MHHVFLITDREIAPADPSLERSWYRDPHRKILESKAFADAPHAKAKLKAVGLDLDEPQSGSYKLSAHNLLPPQPTREPWDALAAGHCAKVLAYWIYSNRKDSRLILLGTYVNKAFQTLAAPWGTVTTVCGLPAMSIPHPESSISNDPISRDLARRWVQVFTGQPTDPEAFAAITRKVLPPPHEE